MPATNFFSSFPQEIGRHKLFRLISSGNRPPQNFFSSFPQEIARHKLFRLISSGNRQPQNFFSSFPQEIGSSLTHSFPQAIVSDRIAHAELALTMKGAGTIKGAKNGASRPKRIRWRLKTKKALPEPNPTAPPPCFYPGNECLSPFKLMLRKGVNDEGKRPP